MAPLVAAGYAPEDDGPFDIDMRRPAAGVTEVPLSPGYRVRAARDDETAALVDAMRLVESAPLYRRDMHVVAEAPDGGLAASCITWLDPATGAAEIEPVGTHPEHRGKALAVSVCLDAVRRVHEHGGTEVVIHPRGDDAYPAPRAVYARCGFEPVGRTRLYTR